MPQSPQPQSTSKPDVDATESQENAGTAAAAEQPSRLDLSSSPASSNQALPSQASSSLPAQMLSGQNLEERVKDLRKQLERQVKAPGAPLKSAPFHTASTVQSLPPGTEILILISTPYWYGIETHEGQHGWIMRDQLEQP